MRRLTSASDALDVTSLVALSVMPYRSSDCPPGVVAGVDGEVDAEVDGEVDAEVDAEAEGDGAAEPLPVTGMPVNSPAVPVLSTVSRWTS
ncbi:hypothetical protein ACFQ07_11235, partial [Actinomadura adrarensis]